MKKQRPSTLKSQTLKTSSPHGDIYITLGFKRGRLFETFLSMSHSAVCARAEAESIGRLASLALQCGAKPQDIIDTLNNIQCDPVHTEQGRITSIADSLAKAIVRWQTAKDSNHVN